MSGRWSLDGGLSETGAPWDGGQASAGQLYLDYVRGSYFYMVLDNPYLEHYHDGKSFHRSKLLMKRAVMGKKFPVIGFTFHNY